MTKTVCDICGKELPPARIEDTLTNVKDLNICISSYGKKWDICNECRADLNRWMTMRKTEESENNDGK